MFTKFIEIEHYNISWWNRTLWCHLLKQNIIVSFNEIEHYSITTTLLYEIKEWFTDIMFANAPFQIMFSNVISKSVCFETCSVELYFQPVESSNLQRFSMWNLNFLIVDVDSSSSTVKNHDDKSRPTNISLV